MENMKNNMIYNEWIKEKYNFNLMVTVKFYRTHNNKENVKALNKLICNMNQYTCGRRYRKYGSYLNGIASFEKNKGNTVSNFHIHLLLEIDGWGIKHNINNFNDNLIRSAGKICDSNYERVFNCSETKHDKFNSDGVTGLNSGCIHIIETYSEGAVNYVTKESNYLNDNIKFLCLDGLSDSCLYSMNCSDKSINSNNNFYHI